MRVALTERGRDERIAVLAARVPPGARAMVARYPTQTGALLRIDGVVAGAFDREHKTLAIAPAAREREFTLEVELRALPTNALPSGDGLRWWLMNRRAAREPHRELVFDDAAPAAPRDAIARAAPHDAVAPAHAVAPDADVLPLWGHSHLDVAWLWTYDDARRKAMRTFANAAALLDEDPGFVFAQSQPQLYAFVDQSDPEFAARIADAVARARFDPDVAALWVESDCNMPSGESLLRQMLAGHRYCLDRFGIAPSIAWLPDTFGFARTLPSLLAHAGIAYFGTTKLQWNDTTPFELAQFVWRGPDGAEVVAASMAGMDGGCTPERVRTARARAEPLIVGYGDGGGGPTAEQLETARGIGRWERPRAWFDRLAARRDALPVHDDELYLEYHRGTYTTHHDVKARNAALERRLAAAEESAAWCVALRLPAPALERMRALLRQAWEIVLRNQFHDVLPGTSIAAVYDDAHREYDAADRAVDAVAAIAAGMLPRARPAGEPQVCAPREIDGVYEFENQRVRARVLRSGTIVELARAGGARNVVAQANVLAYYRDRPKKWDAWNVDAGYDKRRKAAVPGEASVDNGALEIPFDVRRSRATMRVSLQPGDAFLRVDLAVNWRERHRLLRLENWLALDAGEVIYGAPHGTVTRSALTDTPQRRARFEVPGQRFALARDRDGNGVACFAKDTYGWNGRALPRGGLHVGHSLLRGPTWPDPRADRGEHRFALAYAPVAGASVGDVERAWGAFANEPCVQLFESADPAVLVAACKPAEDGDGVILRVRECDGAARPLRVRCGGRMREVVPVDGLERAIDAPAVRIVGEDVAGEISAYALRSFRVRFS